MASPFNRLLLTGAGAAACRARFFGNGPASRSVSDRVDCGAPAGGEEVVLADLENAAAVHALLEGVDAVLHFGGISLESPFEQLVPANIVGLYNVYQAAHRHKVRRAVYASSSHVVGFHRQSATIGIDAPKYGDS
jgi:uronate dehydrogenase